MLCTPSPRCLASVRSSSSLRASFPLSQESMAMESQVLEPRRGRCGDDQHARCAWALFGDAACKRRRRGIDPVPRYRTKPAGSRRFHAAEQAGDGRIRRRDRRDVLPQQQRSSGRIGAPWPPGRTIKYLLELSLNDVKQNGTYHALKVEVDRKDVKIQAREGYFAPQSAEEQEIVRRDRDESSATTRCRLAGAGGDRRAGCRAGHVGHSPGRN